MDGAEHFKIKVKLADIEQPFSLTVKRNTEEERIFREATKMINSYYNEYKNRIKGLDSTSYYGMVALLIARLYIDTSDSKNELESQLNLLEKDITTYLENIK